MASSAVRCALVAGITFLLTDFTYVTYVSAFRPLPNKQIQRTASAQKGSFPPSTFLHLYPPSKPSWSSLNSQYVPLDGSDTKLNGENSTKPPRPPLPLPKNDNDIESLLEYVIPTVAPIIAFFTYEYVAQGFSVFVEYFSQNNWFAVDGGQLQAKIIAPAINGIVIPAIALLYATLASTTITTLRQRQVDIRKSINLEAGELRNLGHIVYVYPEGPVRDLCRSYLLQYVKRLLHECRPNVSDASDAIDPRKGMDTELNGFLIQVHEGYNNPLPPHLADQSFAAVTRLREYRMHRITALQSTYPILHWLTLGSLAFAACTSFLIETNQDILYFLQAFQLKILWSTLVGTFVACFTVFYDLGSPFAGQYKISASIEQLHTIKEALKAAIVNNNSPEIIAQYSGAIADQLRMNELTNEQALAVDVTSVDDFSTATLASVVAVDQDSEYYPPKVDATANGSTGKSQQEESK